MFVSLLAVSLLGATPKLASPEWTVVNISPELANFYAEETARFLRARGVEIVTSRDIATVIGLERQRQLMGCDDGTSCMAELGAAMGSEAVLLANLAKLDSDFRGSLRVISSQSGKALVEIPIGASGEKALVDALEQAATEIGWTLRPETRPAPVYPRERAWIPLVAGVLLAGGGAAMVAIAHGNYAAILEANPAQAQRLAADGKILQPAGWACLGVGGAALVGSALMFIFGGPPPVTPTVAVGSSGAMVGLSLELP